MSKTTKTMIKTEIANLVRVASGEEVNGVRLGDAGITQEWIAEAIRARQEMLESNQ